MWKFIVIFFAAMSTFAKSEPHSLEDWPYGKIPTISKQHAPTILGQNVIDHHHHNLVSNNSNLPENSNKVSNKEIQHDQTKLENSSFSSSSHHPGTEGTEGDRTFDYAYIGEDGEDVRVYVAAPEYLEEDSFDHNYLNDIHSKLSNSTGRGHREAKSSPIKENSDNSTSFLRQGENVESSTINPPTKPCRIHHYHHHHHNQVHNHHHCFHAPVQAPVLPSPTQASSPQKSAIIHHHHHHNGCPQTTPAGSGGGGGSGRKLFEQDDQVLVFTDNGTSPEERKETEGIEYRQESGRENHLHHHYYHNHSKCRHVHHHAHHHRHVHHHHFHVCPTNSKGGLSRTEFDAGRNDLRSDDEKDMDDSQPGSTTIHPNIDIVDVGMIEGTTTTPTN